MIAFAGRPQDCLPPLPALVPPRVALPPGSWDCHAHVIGAPPDDPLVADRHYTAQPQSVDTFLSVLDTMGVRFATLVQVSVHGTDNRLLARALRTHRDRLRGVAVISPEIGRDELYALADAGVTGVRLLDIVGGGVAVEQLDAIAARCREVGWHIQLGLKADRYIELLPKLLRLNVPIVIDHMGWSLVKDGPDAPGLQAVLRLVREDDCWVKLSGAFRMSQAGPPWLDTVPMTQALVQVAPDRMVWGSDWPHVGITEPAALPEYGALLDLLAVAIPDGAARRRVLVDNPAKLYGLPSRP